MELLTIRKVEVKASPISGKGTFAKEKISKGEFITRLSGMSLTSKQLDIIYPHQVDDPLQIDHYMFLILNYDSKVINHSCDPNAGLRTVLSNSSDLYALKDIEVGEEITYDYSTTVGILDDWTMECNCNSLNCRKKLGNVLSVPVETLKKYDSLNALQDFIKEELQKVYHSLLEKS